MDVQVIELQVEKGYAASGGTPAGGGSTSEQWGSGSGTW